MSRILVPLADAVVAELESGTFSIEFEPTRNYDTDSTLEELDELRVDVVPVRNRSEHGDRDSLEYLASVDIAIRKRFSVTDQDGDGRIALESVDELIGLLEEINEYLASKEHWRLTDLDTAVWESGDIRTPWVPTHLREGRQFTAILRVTYRVEKEL